MVRLWLDVVCATSRRFVERGGEGRVEVFELEKWLVDFEIFPKFPLRRDLLVDSFTDSELVSCQSRHGH